MGSWERFVGPLEHPCHDARGWGLVQRPSIFGSARGLSSNHVQEAETARVSLLTQLRTKHLVASVVRTERSSAQETCLSISKIHQIRESVVVRHLLSVVGTGEGSLGGRSAGLSLGFASRGLDVKGHWRKERAERAKGIKGTKNKWRGAGGRILDCPRIPPAPPPHPQRTEEKRNK